MVVAEYTRMSYVYLYLFQDKFYFSEMPPEKKKKLAQHPDDSEDKDTEMHKVEGATNCILH